MQAKLSASQWRRIAKMWVEIGQSSHVDIDPACQRAAEGLTSLLDASHVLMVVHRRIAPEASPLGGFRPVFSRYLGPDGERRRRITLEWIESEPNLDQDPVLRRLAAGAGKMRTVRHRADIDPKRWENAPTRRLLERLGLEDRTNVVVPLGPDVEVSFCIDRPTGAPIFDGADNKVMLAAVEGLRPLAASFVRSHGLMPGQRNLDSRERRVVELLLSEADDDEIADSLGVSRERATNECDEVYRKLGVNDRVELMSMWLKGNCTSEGISAEARGKTAESLVLSPLEKVREALRSLETDDFQIETVARRLGMSVRSLQRQLSVSEKSYREVADDFRLERAKELLSRPSLSFTEIALRLGYGQASSFNRAVKRWTGQTPSELRDELLEDA